MHIKIKLRTVMGFFCIFKAVNVQLQFQIDLLQKSQFKVQVQLRNLSNW